MQIDASSGEKINKLDYPNQLDELKPLDDLKPLEKTRIDKRFACTLIFVGSMKTCDLLWRGSLLISDTNIWSIINWVLTFICFAYVVDVCFLHASLIWKAAGGQLLFVMAVLGFSFGSFVNAVVAN